MTLHKDYREKNRIDILCESLIKTRISYRDLTIKEPFRHIAVFFNAKNLKPFAIGENNIRNKWCGNYPSVHAEIDALMKFITNKRYECLKVDLLVLRVSKLGKLGISRPCSRCISRLYTLMKYRIRYVYYSTADGYITREKFNVMTQLIN